jgi:MFS family permease
MNATRAAAAPGSQHEMPIASLAPGPWSDGRVRAKMRTMQAGHVRTDIPARLDRLPWSTFHWRVLLGLGTVWILDGLEVTIVGALGDRLTQPGSGLGLSATQVGAAASAYVTGAVLGALVFGYLTDRLGRKRMFLFTLLLYLAATVLTSLATSAAFFFACRFFTGAAIGGEYSAINSAIDELIPARVRGTVDLVVNGSFWIGAMAGAGLAIVLLDPARFPLDVGWRLAFGLGAVLGIAIVLVRRHVPESPRWLFLHGRLAEAERIVVDIEAGIVREHGDLAPVAEVITIAPRPSAGPWLLARTLLRTYPRRTALGLALFVGQAFLYNAIFFTQALVLSKFFGVTDARVGLFIIPLAAGNFLGPLVLGGLFDRIGRKAMIATTFIAAGGLLVVTGVLFQAGLLGAVTLTVGWVVVFFFASAAASAAYLTVSEIFPMEIRAMAIALFYSVGTGLGGIAGPLLFGLAIESGTVGAVAAGYYLGAVLMILAGVVEVVLGVEAARKSLEQVAPPLSSVE